MPAVPAVLRPALPASFRRIDGAPGGGTIWRGTIPGRSGGVAGPSIVYLPPGFSRRRRYPVLYLLHGMPGSPYEYWHSMHLASVADRLIAQTRTPFVAIAPAAGSSYRYNGEWTGPWEDYLVGDIVPWVDANLPTIRGPTGRVLAGISAGGYGAIDIGLRHAGVFGTLESWSGYFRPLRDGTLAHLARNEMAAYDPTKLVRRKAAVLRRLRIRFFLSTGPGHGKVDPRQTSDFAAELRSLGLRYELWLVPRSREATPYFPQFLAGLRFAFSAAASP